MSSVFPSISVWMDLPCILGKGVEMGTKRESILYFFYEGLSPWIQSFGYKWIEQEYLIASYFIRFCYTTERTLSLGTRFTLKCPIPNHRNDPEDRNTFEYLITTDDFLGLIDEWELEIPILKSRLQYCVLDFCYTWINVESGRPGDRTQKNLDELNYNSEEDDTQNHNLPDAYSKRRKNDLY